MQPPTHGLAGVVELATAPPPRPLTPAALARHLHQFADRMDRALSTYQLELTVREFIDFVDERVPDPDAEKPHAK